MPRHSFPTAMPSDAPTKAPKQKRKKRPASRKNDSKPARKRTDAKTKRSQHLPIPPLLRLPAPRRVPLLTYAGQSHQISSGATTIDLAHTIDRPTAPQRVGAVPQDDPALSGARVTAAPEAGPQRSRGPVPSRVRRTYSVDPRAAAKIGLTGAIIGAVLLLVRMSPVKPNDEIITYDLTPAKTMLVQNIAERSDAGRTATGERSDAVVRTATQPSRSVHRSNFARMIRAKRSQHGAAHVRIIDAPTRIKQSCGEQTWPYIADYCLAVAKDDVSPAPASPIAANPSTASARRDAAGGVDPSSTQAIHVGDAAGSHSTGNGLAETNSYQTAALLDDAPATIENEKSEPARRASEPRHYERRYARSRQASTEDERPVRVRHASVRRHYEARRHYAWSRQRRERRFAGGAPPAMPTGFFYAPWY